MKMANACRSERIIKKMNYAAMSDWEFVDSDTSYATHNFHRYPSKFIPQIASNLIEFFSSKGDMVLDVFAGSGTTLVESKSLSRNSIGIDLNPLACLISRVKTRNIEDTFLRTQIYTFLDKVRDWVYIDRGCTKKQLCLYGSESKDFRLPLFPYIEDWFQPQVVKELTIIAEGIRQIKNDGIKEFVLCALSSIIRGVSNAKSGFGNLMIDKDKRPISNTFEVFEKHIVKMIDGMREFNKIADKRVYAKVYTGDARNIDFIDDSSIDLIVTHPPYIASVPYAEYQKLSMNWIRESFPEMFKESFGENMHPKNLDKNIIGGKRGRKDVVYRFITDMEKVLREMYRVLKKKRLCCIVIGNPIVFGQQVELNKMLTNMAEDEGFSFEQEIIRGKYRTTMGKMKEEYILVLKKGM